MLNTLKANGMGSNMLRALKRLYSSTKVVLNNVGSLTSTSGIRQDAASSAYIFIIFVNGLFKHLRDIYGVNSILGIIHNLVHADDTIVLDTSYGTLISIQFFRKLNQSVNISKTKYTCIGGTRKLTTQDIFIDGTRKHTTQDIFIDGTRKHTTQDIY